MLGTLQANTKHAINRLLNGGMYRAGARVRADLVTAVTGATAITGNIPESAIDSRTREGSTPVIGVEVDRPKESLLAAWYCYGVRGLVEVKAIDNQTGSPVRSVHGPAPARFTLLENGTMTVEQPVAEFWGLLDREVTLSFLLKRAVGDVVVKAELDYGNTRVTLAELSTRNHQTDRITWLVTRPPYDATAFTVRFTITGSRDQSCYLGEVMLQLGNMTQPQFTDDVSLTGQPRHTAAFFASFPAPPGYISQCEVDGRFVYPTSGDARTDGTARGNTGGSVQHNHGGRTSNDHNRTKIEKGGRSFVSRTHRHDIDMAEVDPPWVKLLLVEKL